jgi:hypothetical protein
VVHAIHVGLEGRAVGRLDLITVVVGLPFAATFYALRMEAFFGGRGDRFVLGTPAWLMALPTLAGMYVTALAFRGAAMLRPPLVLDWELVPQGLLVAIYVTIGYFLFRTQLHNHGSFAAWSLSGGAMTGIFLTCAIMHGLLIVASLGGRPMLDGHGFVVNLLGVPAGLYFLSVVRALYHDALRDWNASPVEEIPVLAPAGRPA